MTGCSSGIGRTTALRLQAAGYPVYASARNVAPISDLAEQPGITTLTLDVTDEGTMNAAAWLRAVTTREPRAPNAGRPGTAAPAWLLLLATAAGIATPLLAVAGRYGYHRDELGRGVT